MAEGRREFVGGCHCGALRVCFVPSIPPEQVPLRQCACSFCRRHGATTATDPAGRLAIDVVDLAEAVRYRFGPRTADFLLCGRCGVYVAAVMETEGGTVATLNINVLKERAAFTAQPESISYEGESAQHRRLRRAKHWTLTTVTVV